MKSRVLRMGMENAPPWYLLRPDKGVEGPLVEIVEEAARRRGIRIRWEPDPVGPEHGLTAGNADLWGMMGRLPSRIGRFPMTDSWIHLTYVLTSAVSCSAPPDFVPTPHTIAHRNSAVVNVMLSRFPGVVEIPVETHADGLRAVCSGAAEAALIAEASQPGGYWDAPTGCRERNICLKSSPVESIGFGVGARPGMPEAVAAAGELRDEIDRMIDDGSLPGALLRWGISSGEIRALRSERIAAERARLMSLISIVLMMVLVALSVVYARLLKAKHAAEAVQAELRQSQSALKEEFERRTSLEQRYYQSQKLESLGRLAGGVAHDFNNLLTVILGFAELALSQKDAVRPVEGLLHKIRSAGLAAAGLTRQLLAFSRKQMLDTELIDVNRLVREAQTLLTPLLGNRVEVKLELDPLAGRVLSDPSQMHQVLVNLAVNAKDAMPEGGILTIATQNLPAGDATSNTLSGKRALLLTVTDTGTGFEPEALEHLFEPFYTTKGRQGTGLGLSTVYGIVQQSGGRITVKTAPRGGASFRIVLPVTEDEPERPAPIAAPVRSDSGSILLVEDDPNVRHYAASVLRQAGYQVAEAETGEKALCVDWEKIDLLVTDVMMPGITGPELAVQLRGRRPRLRVLYISGHLDAGSLEQVSGDQAAWFLQKPFDGDGLTAKVREAIAGVKA